MYDVCSTSVQLLLYYDSDNIYDKNFKLEHIAIWWLSYPQQFVYTCRVHLNTPMHIQSMLRTHGN